MLRLRLGIALGASPLGASLRVGLKESLTPGLGDIKYDKKTGDDKWALRVLV